MAKIASTEPVGTTARLNVWRLGAARLGAILRPNQMTTTGTYAWVRSDGAAAPLNDGRPPVSVTGGWTTVRS